MITLPPIAVPVEALSQHAGVLGKTGSGKTYAAKGMVEHLLQLGRRVCVLDPTGAWWGLRSSADGASPGFAVTIFGGDHADVPITEHAGHAVGELVGSGNVPAVIDLSGTTLGERHRFVERFAETLFRVNKKPLHLVIDEADEFAPQSGAPGTERMLGAVDRIVRRGRIKGFRVIMISQRPAVLNKNVLTQCNTLIAMRLPASQDRKAIELWVKGQADESQADQLLASLASLKRGEGWVWAPELGVLERKHFPAIATFDSSRTPDDGEAVEAPRRMAEVDLAAVRQAMAAAIEESESNDTPVLKAKIARLQGDLNKALRTPVTVHPGNVEKQIAEAVERELAQTAAAIHRSVTVVEARGESIADRLRDIRDLVDGVLAQAGELRQLAKVPQAHPHASVAAPAAPAASHRTPAPRGPVTDAGHRGDLTNPQRKLIDAVAWWNAIGIQSPSRVQVALVAGYTPSGGTWKTLLSECRVGGLVEYAGEGLVLTSAGFSSATHPEAAPTREQLHDRVREVLSNPQRKLFDVLVVHGGGREMARTAAAELAGYEATGGTWKTLVSELSTLGLCRYPKRTTVQAAAWLFPESTP